MLRRRRRRLGPIETLEQRTLLTAVPLISEFLADNKDGLRDAEGDSADWIEIHNAGTSAIDLGGWYLTDDANDLQQWQFPSVVLAPDGYLIVFASGKYPNGPPGELHANFQLSKSGEFLALVEPDGTTIAHSFAPFPAQDEDISYGVFENVRQVPLLQAGDATRVLVPPDASLGTAWTAAEFDDAAWSAGQSAIGYDVVQRSYFDEVKIDDPIAYWRLSQTGDATAAMANRALATDGFASGIGSAVDSAALKFDGAESMRGAPSLLAGDGNLAVRFDGIDDHIHIPDNAAIGNSGAAVAQRTVELWFQADAVPLAGSNVHQVLWDEGGSTHGMNVYLYQGEVYFGAYVNSAGSWISAPVESGEIYHALFTYDSVAGAMRGYLNGVPIAETIDGPLPAVIAHSGDNAIGRVKQDTRFEDGLFSGDGAYYDGVIDELSLYNRILSAERAVNHFAASQSGVPRPELIAYWPFDTTADGGITAPDVTGKYDADIVGAELTTDGGGRLGEAMRFNGNGDYVNAGVIDELVAPGAFTVSLWFQRAADDAADATNHQVNNVLIAKSSAGANDNFELGTQGTAVESYIHSAALEGPAPSFAQEAGIQDNLWTHLAFSYDLDRTNEVKLYVNGTLTAEFSDWGGSLVSSTTSPLSIGIARPGDEAWGDFEGLIDEVALWRGALSDDQIAAIAAGASPLDGIGFENLIVTDVREELYEQNASIYLRSEFDLGEDPADFDRLALRVRYDDGFVAYLNGVEVARRNAPEPLAFDSAAINSRSNAEAVVAETIDLTGHLDLLVQTIDESEEPPVAGKNVLAIHALNISADDNDLLIEPEIIASIDLGSEDRYFSRPTPGSENSAAFLGFLGDTRFSIDRGFSDAPFQLEITADDADADIVYTTNGSVPSASNGTVYSGPITISTTTTVRASLVKPGFLPRDIDTQTYIFLQDVLQQPAAPAGFPATWGSVAADYEVDPDIVNDPLYSDLILDALRTHPTVSLVLDPDDIFGQVNGIYSNTLGQGEAWERAVSIELIDFAAADNTQVDAGIRISGNASRSTTRPKHNMRVIFRSEYGPGKLDFPFFGDTAHQSIDQIILRGGNGDSWFHPDATRRDLAQYIRDQWHRDTQVDMGQPTSQQGCVHLYINGLYWGLYHTIERPEASFMAEHFGGEPEDYDVVQHANQTVDGDRTAWNAMMNIVRTADLTTDAGYQQVLQYIDPVNLADFMLLNFYSGNADWDLNNWYGGRKREAGATWKFFAWDSEVTFLDLNRNNTGLRQTNQPTEIHQALSANEEYRTLFADRVQEHFFNSGSLSPEAVEERWLERVAEIELALVAESARWGDDDRPNQPYTVENEFRTALADLQATWFPQRSDIVLNQLIARDVYPNVVAPMFNQHGGRIEAGFELTISAPSGAIYYTLDGSDPRAPGGSLAAGAILWDGSAIPLSQTRTASARALDGGEWSALNAADFLANALASAENLALAEIHFSPAEAETNRGELATSREQFEFIELVNFGAERIDLNGVQLSHGVSFQFDVLTLAPGERIVVTKNLDAFQSRYGSEIFVAGEYEGDLANGGNRLVITSAAGERIVDFSFDTADVPQRAKGVGSSLEPVFLPEDLPDVKNWRASNEVHGSPGTAGTGPIVDVVINEVLSHTDDPLSDSVELYNTTAAAIDISGWLLSDSTDFRKFVVPANTILEAGAYFVVDEFDFNSGQGTNPDDFALDGAQGDDLWLVAADSLGALVRFVDYVEFEAQANGESWGRWPNGSGGLYPQLARSLAAENSGPRVGPLLISEIMFNPPDPDGPAGIDAADLEFIEIVNLTSTAVDLTEWRIRQGIDFDFDPGAIIAAGEAIVVLRFNPDKPENTTRTAQFRATYGIGAEVRLFGGFSGRLSDDGEALKLQRPDEPPDDGSGFIPRLLEDATTYDDQLPWPVAADGGGKSLTRLGAGQWGPAPASWAALSPTPGSFRDLARSFQVAEVAAAPQRVDIRFVRDVGLDELNLYDGQDPAADLPDIFLEGDTTGPIPGSLLWDAATQTARFLPTGDPLLPDNYTLTLVSRTDGFVDSSGEMLDGDGDGNGGDNFTVRFTVAPSNAPQILIDDFARGPAQLVKLKATNGLPLRIRNAAGALQVSFRLKYDIAALFTGNMIPGANMPNDWSVTGIDPIAPGEVQISLAGSTALANQEYQLLVATALVRDSLPLGEARAVSIGQVFINDGSVAGRGDDAIQVIGFLGDISLSGDYSALDAALIARAAVNLDSGFDSISRIDPRILGDTTGDGTLSALDAALVARKAVGLDQPAIPDLPPGALLAPPRFMQAPRSSDLADAVARIGLLDLAGTTRFATKGSIGRLDRLLPPQQEPLSEVQPAVATADEQILRAALESLAMEGSRPATDPIASISAPATDSDLNDLASDELFARIGSPDWFDGAN